MISALWKHGVKKLTYEINSRYFIYAIKQIVSRIPMVFLAGITTKEMYLPLKTPNKNIPTYYESYAMYPLDEQHNVVAHHERV